MTAQVPVPGGRTPRQLRDVLAEVSERCEIVGAEDNVGAPGFGEGGGPTR